MTKEALSCLGTPALLSVRIWRGGAEGAFVDYEVPKQANQTVLDIVTWVQRHAAPDLAYRFACRVGMCGSCAMTVNGRPRWTCRTHVDKVAKDGALTIAPLANLPVLRDLVADMAPFFKKWQRAGESLFEKTNREISANLSKVYEGTCPATLRRYGETDDRSDEVV